MAYRKGRIMKCPKCGADNPEQAQFCTLCMEKIDQPVVYGTDRMPQEVSGDKYLAPGEWRGDRDSLHPAVSEKVVSKLRRFRLRMAFYAVIVAAIVTWLVLSFTVWGNPSAGERSMQFIGALNDRNPDVFITLFEERNRAAAEDIYARTVSYLGGGGRYEKVKLDVEKQSEYNAVSFIASATLTSDGSSREVSRSDNLMIVLENHEGRWYVVPGGTDVIP